MRFAYRPYPVDPSPSDPSPISYRPELRVQVRGTAGPSDGIPIWGILDPAAIDCILPYDTADRLHPTWYDDARSMQDFAGGLREVRYGRVTFQVQIGGRRVRWPAIVAFSRERRIALWGRCGFLNHFRVTFDGPGRHFTIRLRGSMQPGFKVDILPKGKGRPSKKGDVIAPEDQSP
jgi:hypothetical protein